VHAPNARHQWSWEATVPAGERWASLEIVPNRWQDAIDGWSQPGAAPRVYDAVMFDTYAEDYTDTLEFCEQIAKQGLLKPAGLMTFFNGVGSYDLLSYVVMSTLMAILLEPSGIGVTYTLSHLPFTQRHNCTSDGQRSRQWAMDAYLLPVCCLKPVETCHSGVASCIPRIVTVNDLVSLQSSKTQILHAVAKATVSE